ncbi:MAG: PP2C family protein-serine/threonine phosphatase [Chloroflexota bacterium]
MQPNRNDFEAEAWGGAGLADLLSSRPEVFAGLAAGWLESGAGFFGVWNEERLLRGWPAGAKPAADEPGLAAEVHSGGRCTGRLQVQIANPPAWQARLSSEAGLLSAWLQSESDAVVITADLGQTQDQLLALYGLSRSLRSQLELPQIIQALTGQAVQLTKARTGFMRVYAPDERGSEDRRSSGSSYYGPRWLDDAQESELFEQAAQQGKALLLAGEQLPRGLPAEVKALYLVPIKFNAAPVGVLGLAFNRPAGSISPELKLSRAIGRQAEAHLENALLHRRAMQQVKLRTELDLAQQIQRQLLPEDTPRAEGLDIAAQMRPADRVGGDIYDFIPGSGQSFYFILGDAAGKSIPAALLMSMTHTVFQSAARLNPGATPQALLDNAITSLYDDFTRTGLFVTVFTGQYLAESRRVLYANAGHSPVVYRPAGGPARILEADSPPLGVLPDNYSRNQACSLQPGDLLIVATDGFNEARREDGEMFGYQRLLEMIDALAQRPAGEIVAAFYQQVDAFCSGFPQEDDQTIIVIKGI